MSITLDQLKEIAKAGYRDNPYLLSLIDDSNSTERERPYDNEIELYNVETSETLLVLRISDNLVYLGSEEFIFNHLAAIRKMEELGIIEK